MIGADQHFVNWERINILSIWDGLTLIEGRLTFCQYRADCCPLRADEHLVDLGQIDILSIWHRLTIDILRIDNQHSVVHNTCEL